MLFVAGATVWMMRSSYRRTDLVIFPTKRWFQPEGSTKPSRSSGWRWVCCSRLPNAGALLALLPCLWACRCLWARNHYRHHADGLVSQLRRNPTRRRRVRLLR